MVNAILISADSRMTLQVKDWFRELAHDVRLEAFSSLTDFAKAFTDDSEAELNLQKQQKLEQEARESSALAGTPSPAAINSTSLTTDPKLAVLNEIQKKSRIRLLIVDADLLSQKASAWAVEIRRILATRGFEDPDLPIRILLLAFDDPHVPVSQLRHPSINDLVLKPLERSLFLQKIEFLIADTPDVKPSFLFRQPVRQMIEMGKDAWLEEISEFVISIANPTPLKNGMIISVRSEIFGEGAASQVYARVIGNLRHPVREGAFLVRMTYFGISNEQLARVRHYVRDYFQDLKHRPPKLDAAKRAPPVSDTDREGAIEKRVAIIEMNREILGSIESSLRSHFSGLDVRGFSSYARFMGELIRNTDGGGQSTPVQTVSLDSIVPASEEEADLLSIAAEAGISSVLMSEPPPRPTARGNQESSNERAAASGGASPARPPAFPQGKTLSVILDAVTHRLIRFDAPLLPGALILGRKLMDWNQQLELWSNSVHKEDREEYLEFLNYINHGAQGHAMLRWLDVNGEIVYGEIKGNLEKSSAIEPSPNASPENEKDKVSRLRVDVREIEAAQWNTENEKHRGEEDHLAFQFDIIFVDGSFIRGDLASWITGLKALFTRTGVNLANGELPPIVILGEDRSVLTPQNFRQSEIFGFLGKPLDRRMVIEMVAQFVPGVTVRADSDALSVHPCKVEVCTSTDALMSGISEFGLSILQNQQASSFRTDTYMRFFSPIFGNLAKGVLGRCAYSQAVSENEKIVSESHFHFFGVSDELFKRIRTWIVENYVHSKQGS